MEPGQALAGAALTYV